MSCDLLDVMESTAVHGINSTTSIACEPFRYLVYSTCAFSIFPLNLNGALSKYSRPTGEPRSIPKSRQSLAVNPSGALMGTTPEAASLPLTFNTTFSGPAGLDSPYRVSTSIFTLPVGSFSLALIWCA
jgi:hypothetical protein